MRRDFEQDVGVVLSEASRIYRLSPEAIFGTGKDALIVEARHCTWYALYTLGWSFRDIASRCARNHSTVQNGVQRISERRRVDQDINGVVDALYAKASGVTVYQAALSGDEAAAAVAEQVADSVLSIVEAARVALDALERAALSSKRLQQARREAAAAAPLRRVS